MKNKFLLGLIVGSIAITTQSCLDSEDNSEQLKAQEQVKLKKYIT